MKRLLFLVLMAPVMVAAGPLGFEMGQSADEISKKVDIKEVKRYVYASTTTPNPNDNFDSYALVITPEHGLCKIMAKGREFQSSSFGDEVISRIGSLSAALEKKYGAPKKFDYVKVGSMWDERKYWMMGLLKGDRTLAHFWGADGESLADNIRGISLTAKATSINSASITLSYDFNNAKECLAKLKEEENSSL